MSQSCHQCWLLTKMATYKIWFFSNVTLFEWDEAFKPLRVTSLNWDLTKHLVWEQPAGLNLSDVFHTQKSDIFSILFSFISSDSNTPSKRKSFIENCPDLKPPCWNVTLCLSADGAKRCSCIFPAFCLKISCNYHFCKDIWKWHLKIYFPDK